jgi:hypothetical protein
MKIATGRGRIRLLIHLRLQQNPLWQREQDVVGPVPGTTGGDARFTMRRGVPARVFAGPALSKQPFDSPLR